MNFDSVVEQYHRALDDFSRGDPEPAKRLFSPADDVTLANPWGPPVRGWKQLGQALQAAASKFAEGKVEAFDTIARYETSELATMLELEHWKARVGGRPELSAFSLRVTTTFRRENGTWKLVHRHADPITRPNTQGPLIGQA